MKCPNCGFIFGGSAVQLIAAWYSGHDEPAPAAPTAATPASTGYAPIAFASPATSPGGQAHLTIGDASAGTRPTALTVVFMPAGTFAEATATVAALVGNAAYPQDTVQIPDATTLAVSLAATGVTPGMWDVAAIATYPDA